MKFLLTFVLTTLILVGCDSNAPVVEDMDISGKWVDAAYGYRGSATPSTTVYTSILDLELHDDGTVIGDFVHIHESVEQIVGQPNQYWIVADSTTISGTYRNGRLEFSYNFDWTRGDVRFSGIATSQDGEPALSGTRFFKTTDGPVGDPQTNS